MATAYTTRKHVVIFSGKCLYLWPVVPAQPQLVPAMPYKELVELSMDHRFELYFTSHQPPSQEMLAAIPSSPFFVKRGPLLREFIKQRSEAGQAVIICGAVDEDLHVAASTKSFLICASWALPEPQVVRYGIPAPTPSKMAAILQIIANQSSWYYSCEFNDPVPTKVVSLCLANTFKVMQCPVGEDEAYVAEEFQAILKDGKNNPFIKTALICHLMAAILHDPAFKEVQDWAIAPSSTIQPNQTMEELKEHVRYMMYGRKRAPLFFRHTATTRSREERSREKRQDPNYCQKHFESIHVNEEYRGKLRGRVVCVFDDYLTHGSTFESLRNLLVFSGVRKIIFVSIGKFVYFGESAYVQKAFTINGDVHQAGNYSATFSRITPHVFFLNDNARRSLEDLRELACHLA